MACLGPFPIAAMMVVSTLDVVVRNLGYQSSAHFFSFTEYALLIVPCLGAPWLVREKGHIFVEILLMHLGPTARRWLMRFIDMPRWMVVVWIPVSFLMMAIEFARFMWRGEDFLGSISGLLGS